MTKLLFPIAVLFLAGCTTLSKPFLYEAKAPSNSLYILGTVHLGVPVDDLPSSVMERFDRAQTFDLELDNSNYKTKEQHAKDFDQETEELTALLASLKKKAPERAEKLAKQFRLTALVEKPLAPKELKLSQRLTPEAWRQVSNYFQQVDPAVLENISPSTVTYFLEKVRPVMIEGTQAFFNRLDPKFSMDLNLLKRARNSDKWINQLDDMEKLRGHCMDLLDSERILATFEKREGNEALNEFTELERAYRSGSESEMARVANRLSPEMSACLIADRNQSWLPAIIEDSERAAMHGQSPMFVAVGTAHLFGPQGLLELLKSSGYTVRRVEK